MNNQNIQQQLLEAFSIEARERIESMFSTLTELEKSIDPEKRQQGVEIVFREAHSLKGAARSVNLPLIEMLCQAMEGVFSKLKEGTQLFSTDIFDTFHEAVGIIEKYLEASEENRPNFHRAIEELTNFISDGMENLEKRKPIESQTIKKKLKPSSDFHVKSSEKKKRPEKLSKQNLQHEAKEATLKPDKQQALPAQKIHTKPLFADTVRISIAKLDTLLLKSEELITSKQILHQHLDQIKETGKSIRLWEKQWEAVKPDLKKIEELSETHSFLNRFVQFAESNDKHLSNFSRKTDKLIKAVEQSNRLLGGMVDDLLDEIKKTSLLPFSTLFSTFPRMVRDIARELGKEVDIEFYGGDIEIDKRILEGIKDPMVHLLRNAVDHGIEDINIRKQNQKSPCGQILVTVSQPESNKVKIVIKDDGRGINVNTIREKVIGKGAISSENAKKLTDEQLLSLIFQSGISTSAIITEISGRGLGMAIVKENIENLGGMIFTDSDPGHGTTFTIELPVSLATFRGILVSVSEQLFIIPNVHVEHILKILPDEIKTVENRTVISIKGHAVSLVNLSDVLGLTPKMPTSEQKFKTDTFSMPVIILGSGDKRIAFIVDDIINELEVLVKNLGRQLKRVPNISGATILGTGRVVPILNVSDLIKTSAGKALPQSMLKTINAKKSGVQKSILIVEDSLTARTLLKNILEASGYIIKTAIDGKDGYNQIRSRAFDAVVSDVEMPRMNGFELTKKIRSDQSRSETPVILVTNLDSRVDRERGIEAGADAYIVKSSFDRSNLLDVIKRLI